MLAVMKHSTGSSTTVLGCMSPRTATIALAILGILFHINAFSWLGTLSTSLPDGPENQLLRPPIPFSGKYANSAARVDELINLGIYDSTRDELAIKSPSNPNLPAWIAEAKAYLKAQGLSFIPTSGHAADTSGSKTGQAAQKWTPPGRHTPSSTPTTDPLDYQTIDDGGEDVDRMQWDALRTVIGTLRWYVLISALCCIAGVVGALRYQLLLSRLFVIHSFLDLLLSTLSLLALAIVCTYPTVRAHLCDEFGSGEIQSWFSHSSPAVSHFRSAGTSAGQNLGSSASTLSTGLGKDMHVAASGWETVLDGVFGSENCEESFRTSVVPVFMLCGLLYTALRLQCFFWIQRFHASLLRSKLHQYGYAATSSSSSGDVTPSMHHMSMELRDRRWKEDKLLD